jgi:GntR family transcriptional regulator
MQVRRQIPVAEQVAAMLHTRILEGIYAPGERLPSESEFAVQLEVSRGTVRSALATLATAGLIERRQGDGTYVKDLNGSSNSLMYAIWEFNHLIQAGGRTPSIRGTAVIRRPATEKESRTLQINPGLDVIAIRRIFYADDQPVILSTNSSPITIFGTEIADLDATLGLHGFLQRYCKRQVARIDMDISPILADAEVRQALNLSVHKPILRMEQVFHDIYRKPLVFAINHLSDMTLSLHDVRPWYSWGRT